MPSERGAFSSSERLGNTLANARARLPNLDGNAYNRYNVYRARINSFIDGNYGTERPTVGTRGHKTHRQSEAFIRYGYNYGYFQERARTLNHFKSICSTKRL